MAESWLGNNKKRINPSYLLYLPTRQERANPNSPFFQPNPADRNLPWYKVHQKYPAMRANGDYDGDGFPNSKDCKPMDASRDGIIEAVGGAAKALFTGRHNTSGERMQAVKEAYNEGMSQPNIKRRWEARQIAAARDPEYREQIYQKNKQRVEGTMDKISRFVQGKNTAGQKTRAVLSDVAGYHPKTKGGANISIGQHMQNIVRRTQTGRPLTREARIQTFTAKSIAQGAFPSIPRSEVYRQTVTASGNQSHKRGRPRGSFKYPGGIYNWRKQQRAMKALARAQSVLARQRAVQNYPQMEAQRAYNQELRGQMQQTQEQMQQVPYQQQYQPQPQYQYQQAQPFQQYANIPQRKPIVPVFKSSGGSPYPPVEQIPTRQGLQQQPAPPGYAWDIDTMTSKPYLKKLPQAEAWVR